MIRRILFFSILAVGLFGLFQFQPTLAVSPDLSQPSLSDDPLGVGYGQYTGLSDQDVRVSAARIIRFVLGFLGLIFLLLTLYAGFMWMTSAGNEDRVETAKKILWGAIIGIGIVLFAYAITEFVVTNLYEASTNKPYTTPIP
jgi:hypothetical protein